MNEDWRSKISQPQYGMTVDRDITVPMRDGVNIALNVFRPDAPGKFPALLAFSPYGKEEQELLLPPQPLFKSAVWDGNIEAGDFNEYVARGYVHIIGDIRGTGASEGEYYGVSRPQEGLDGYDLVEWAAQQPWCDGNVGMVGYSYFSMFQVKVAIEQPPHLKAIFISHVGTDNYRDLAYSGGVLSMFMYGIWDGRHGTSGFAPNNAKSEMRVTLTPEEFEKRRRERLEDPDIKHYPNAYHNLLYPHKNPMFFDMLMNPYDNEWWAQQSNHPYLDKIKVPTTVIGKVAHEGSGFWGLYDGIDCPKRFKVKPNPPEERPWREDFEDIIRWYDHWLKGIDTGVMQEPKVEIFVTGENKYRQMDEWPPKDIKYRKMYLNRWEGLSFEPELYMNEPDCFLQQPLYVSSKRDQVVYVSPPLSDDMTVMGPASVCFHASIDTDDTNWMVKIFDVSETGAEDRVAKGYLKASHRELDEKKSTPEEPWHPHTRSVPVKPGEINEYSIFMGMITNTFKAGHRVKVVIDSMESPRDPEMQIHYHPRLPSSRTTLHKIYRDRNHPSHILLPVIPNK